MNKNFSYYISKYLNDYLIIERNFSDKTLKSYKKAFEIFIDYLVNVKKIKITNITFENVTQTIVTDFLNYLELNKGNSISTRNQRLAAIKSFYQYCTTFEINNLNNISQILQIKSKKAQKPIVNYLSEEELKKIFDIINISTKKGKRDLMLLSILYDTAARASEIINVKLKDINIEGKYIILIGKGNKIRKSCLMKETIELITIYIKEFDIKPDDYLFNNNHKKQNSTFVRDVLNKYQKYSDKNLHPHILRHSRAVHLLDHGVSIVYIQELLGHENVSTTQIYATVIEKTKFQAIESVSNSYIPNNLGDWNDDQSLLDHLMNL